MTYFALIYDLVDDHMERRAPYREEHLQRARESLARGELMLGGAFTDPVDHALLIFRAPDRDVVEAFARNDPYITSGLVPHYEIRPWNVVVGGDASGG